MYGAANYSNFQTDLSSLGLYILPSDLPLQQSIHMYIASNEAHAVSEGGSHTLYRQLALNVQIFFIYGFGCPLIENRNFP